jgi:hypothetical protein
MGSNPGRSYKLIFLPSLWIMLKRFGTATRSGSCEAASLGSFSDRRDQKLREMKWAIFLFHSYGYRLERRSMIRGCAGGHRKSRRTGGAIHRRNICGRLQSITFVWGRFQATNIGEVVLIGTHGAQLIVASGAIRRQGFPKFVLHGVSRPHPPVTVGTPLSPIMLRLGPRLNVRFAPRSSRPTRRPQYQPAISPLSGRRTSPEGKPASLRSGLQRRST